MNSFAAVAVKTVGAAGVAALLSVGAIGALAASPSPKPAPTTSTTQPSTDRHADWRSTRCAADASDADIIGVTPNTLIANLEVGHKASDLAHDKVRPEA